jgi:hypothetical protein
MIDAHVWCGFYFCSMDQGFLNPKAPGKGRAFILIYDFFITIMPFNDILILLYNISKINLTITTVQSLNIFACDLFFSSSP